MMKKFGKYLLPAGIMALVAAFFLLGAANLDTPKLPGKNEPPAPPPEPKDAVVLFTNDIHCGIDGYSALAALRASLIEDGLDTIVVDDGDYIQGEMIGGYYKGEPVIELMNAVPYTLATLGNHEFDYGMDQLKKLIGAAKFDVLSCNIEDLAAGKAFLSPYKIVTLGNRKVAFVGVTTPETLTKANPKFFAGADGKTVYSFAEKDLYAKVQAAVDAARKEGAQTVVLVSHLGINGVTPEWTAPTVIANTRGIDVVLDGHSHEVFAGEGYKNADGKEVLYAQTGTKFMYIGRLNIAKDGTVRTELIRPAEVDVNKSEAVKKAYADVQKLIDADHAKLAFLNEKIGVAEVPLATDDPRTGTRRIRSGETNLGDYCADAYRAVTGAQIAIINGGALRTSVEGGDVTRLALMDVNPWNNPMCIAEMTGQAILDLLEFNSRYLPDEECGGFCQVSGMSYEVNAAIPSPVKHDDKGAFAGVEEGKQRRVSNVRVDGMPIDPA
ncbi:MAG: bifunctional metallophosphatase/5'-nucleotidase, partial [Pyramidobacter sp.]|nr:bifunctional metallophosphatase/5'-nucleotidase [Pyramidobacter sp.]